jgi:glycosyltransferase involved in cell wall biosynthesis
MSELLVSVVVPVRNGAAELHELLDSLAAQTLPRRQFEVVVADDGSTDGVSDLQSSEDGWLRVLHAGPVNSYSARNRGAHGARGRVLAFCDVDCRPEPDWLEHGTAALEQGDIAAGLVRFILPDRPSIWSLLDMDAFLDQERSVKGGHAVSANMLVRMEVFERAHGFDESLPSGGDFDFVSRCVAAGSRLVFAPQAVVWHPTRDAARPFLRKIWMVSRCYAIRQRRLGRRPAGLKLRHWIPLLGTLRARRQPGRSLLLDRRRLVANGARPRMWDELRALPLIYLVLPYLQHAAHLRGWRQATRAK